MTFKECKKYIESNIGIFEKTKIESESYKGLIRKAIELDLIANFIYPHIDELYEEVVRIADTVKYSRYTSVSKGMYYPSIYYKTCTTNLNLPKRLLNTPPAGKEYCIYYYRNNELLLVEYKFLERKSALYCFVIKSKNREYAISAYSQGFLNNVYVCEEIFDDCKLLQYTEFKTIIEKKLVKIAVLVQESRCSHMKQLNSISMIKTVKFILLTFLTTLFHIESPF